MTLASEQAIAASDGSHSRRAQAAEFIRYFAVCMAALAVDMGLLAALTELAGWYYLVANAVAFLTGSIVAYYGSIRWAFAKRRLGRAHVEFALFAVIGIGGLGVNSAALWLLTDLLGLYYLISKVAAAGMSFMFNFLVRKFFLFR